MKLSRSARGAGQFFLKIQTKKSFEQGREPVYCCRLLVTAWNRKRRWQEGPEKVLEIQRGGGCQRAGTELLAEG